MRILLVEDDQKLTDALQTILSNVGYQVTCVSDGNTAYQEAKAIPYDVIIMDRMLPGMNGVDVTKKLRADNNKSAIIMVTALGNMNNPEGINYRVEGLDAGADDYITKPFAPSELIARIKAITRRQTPTRSADGLLRYGDLSFDEEYSKLFSPTESVDLSRLETAIMALLMSNPDVPFSKKDIMLQIWGDEQEVSPNNIEAYVSMIRKKLILLDSNVHIKTIRRRGYQLELDS